MVRRLIVATTAPGTLGLLTMPAGDDVRLHGWDGRVELTAEHPYVPSGKSVWEMGVGEDPKEKADKDYKKRMATPSGVTPADTTFVFVTPIVWPGKDSWVAEREAEGHWRGVRAIDGQVLAEWFDFAPAVAAWFHAERGSSVYDIDDVDTSWYRNVEEPLGKRVPPALVIGGRDKEATALKQWLVDPRGDLLVAAESPEEVVWFVDAVVAAAATGEGAVELAPRTLVARDRGAVHYLGALHNPHVVVIENPAITKDLRTARLRNVHLIAPGRRTGGSPAQDDKTLELPAVRRDAIEKQVQAMGYSVEEAGRIARESRGSLQAVLWGLGHAGLRDLPWLEEPAASRLAPLVLARQWTVATHPDHEVVARLADRSYREVFDTATEWRKPGGPLQVWGEYWDWKAWRVAWEQLAPHFTEDLLERFTEVALKVLGTPDPALELPPDERWMQAVRSKTHPYSGALRDGLVSSIAMLAVRGDRLCDVDGPGIAGGLVRRLLDTETLSSSWLSLGPWLPDLAEAAPEVFLAAAERVVDDKGAVRDLFAEGEMFGSNPHVHLLWALERLAWSPELLARVVVLLGLFAEVDPGGGLRNRPENSLFEIFLPWHPGTAAPAARRVDAFDHLSRRCPDVAWRCGMSLMPSQHQTASTTAEPQFRDWRSGIGKTTKAEYHSFVDALVDRVVKMAGSRPQRWTELVGALPNLIQWKRAKAKAAVDTLLGLEIGEWTREERFALGEAVRDIIQRNEEFPEADWSLESGDLDVLRPLSDKFAPERARDQHRALFEQLPRVIGRRKGKWQEEKEMLAQARRQAVVAVRDAEGLQGVMDWANEVESPEVLGATLAELELSDADEWSVISETAPKKSEKDQRAPTRRFGDGFVRWRERQRGGQWGIATFDRIRKAHAADVAVQFAVALAPTFDLWRHLDDVAPDLAAMYWAQVGLHSLAVDEAEFALPRLIHAGRPYVAIVLANQLIHETTTSNASPDLIRRTLDICRLVTKELPKHAPRDEFAAANLSWIGHCISEILGFIEKHDPEGEQSAGVLAKWEWAWLPVLERSRRGIRVLSRELSRSPVFFVDLLRLIYRGKGEAAASETGGAAAAPPDAEERMQRATQAWKLLETWRVVPGLDLRTAVFLEDGRATDEASVTKPAVEGVIDENFLNDWVDRARELAKQADRLDLCDRHIGKVFALAPADADGRWPCGPVRRCIERLSSQRLESGLGAAILDRRGAHYVGPTGEAERKLRDTYREMATQVNGESPRSAAALRSVADRYDREGKQRDDEGRRDEFE